MSRKVWILSSAFLISALVVAIAIHVGMEALETKGEDARIQVCLDHVGTLEATLAELDRKAAGLQVRVENTARAVADQSEAVTRATERARARESMAADRERLAAAREEEAGRIVRTAEASSFGDGTWEVGRDIQPGKYRAEDVSEEQGCYWEKNTGGEGVHAIIDNDGAEGPTTVVIGPNVKFFKSRDCGTWRKID